VRKWKALDEKSNSIYAAMAITAALALAGCARGGGIGLEARVQDYRCEQSGFQLGTPEYAICRSADRVPRWKALECKRSRLRQLHRDVIAFQKTAENPEYKNIKTKLYFGLDNQPPLQKLTDTSRPTKEEIKLLYRVYGDVQECRKILLDGAAKMHPLILLTFIESYAESDKLWAEATGGKLPGVRSISDEKTCQPDTDKHGVGRYADWLATSKSASVRNRIEGTCRLHALLRL
jgi:hypothetical protein